MNALGEALSPVYDRQERLEVTVEKLAQEDIALLHDAFPAGPFVRYSCHHMNPADMHPLPSGLVAVTGEEGSGKSHLLRGIGEQPGALWLDLSLPGRDNEFMEQVWDQLRKAWAAWDVQLQRDLADAFDLRAHVGKKLFMLSTGSRRKVALVGLLASGATVTCLDQPFAALDAASARILREFLTDVADHASRTWVVADYEADARLPWRRQIRLP